MTETRGKLDFALHLDFSAILTNPILDIAARVWEEERYKAFQVCYRSMRLIDDLVDDRKSEGVTITANEAGALERQMEQWLEVVRSGRTEDPFAAVFVETIRKFELPLWPWERLCKAMVYDLSHNGFSSLLAFTRYAEGAAVSPAAIFMHLCGVRKVGDRFHRPPYDIRAAARPLALFSYLVHIMRDFEKDQRSNLNYFADTILRGHRMELADLRACAVDGRVTPNLRAVMNEYRQIAEYYRVKSRREIDSVRCYLEPRYQLSLEMIYGLYLQIFERIDPESGQFTADALNPNSSEVKARIEWIIGRFVPVISA